MSAFSGKTNHKYTCDVDQVQHKTVESNVLAIATFVNWLDVSGWNNDRIPIDGPTKARSIEAIKEFDLELACDATEALSTVQLYGIRKLPLLNADDTFTATSADPSVVTATSHGLLSGDGPFRLHSTDTFTATAADPSVATATTHLLASYDGPFQLTTSGTLPAGLALTTDYWVEIIDANTFYFHPSYTGVATAANRIECTDTGSGTHTISSSEVTDVSALGLPIGMFSGTDYWLEVIDANTFYLCLSVSNVITQTRVAATSTGGGTHTISDKVAALFPSSDDRTGRLHHFLMGDVNAGSNVVMTAQTAYIERIQHSPLNVAMAILATSVTGTQTVEIRAAPIQEIEW